MFSLKACCPTLNILLENDVKDKQGKYEGVYTFHGFNNEMDYWVSPTGEYALWYMISGSSYEWILGPIAEIGSFNAFMYTSVGEKKCPNNEGYILNWNYANSGSWILAEDFLVKCTNEDDFCTSANPCGLNQGDCDLHVECQSGFECGSSNCPDSLEFEEDEDCCVAVSGNSRKTNFEVARPSPILPTGSNVPI